ncbi:MAG: class C sortase [Clostridia bacterium]|nr:class C sortase [Clostridia bacterium]
MKRKIIVVILTIAGLALILYPFVSNYINKYFQTSIITNYEKEVDNLTKEQKEQMMQEAIDYNNDLEKDSFIELSLENTKDESTPPSYLNVLNLGEVMGYINIPKIDVNLPIYHGNSKDVLQKAVGHLEKSSLPIGGNGTHCVLAGHTGLAKEKIFDNIDELEIGDIFYISSLGNTLGYKVDNISIVEPSDTNTIKIVPDKDYVTLVTCTPRYINSHRLLVRGERASEEELTEGAKDDNNKLYLKNNTEISKNHSSYVIVIVILVALGIVITFVIAIIIKKK